MSKIKFNTIFIVTCLVPFFMLIFPIFEIANRAEPIILGLPFSFFWVIIWVLIVFIALLILYKFDPDHKEEEEDV